MRPTNCSLISIGTVLPRVLVCLADVAVSICRKLIDDRSRDLFVRWAAIEAFEYLTRDQVLTRDEVVEILR